MNFKILLLSLALITVSVASSQNSNYKTLNYLEKEMKDQKIPGLQIVVIKENKILMSEALGLSEISFSVKNQKNTLFSINSIAKVFASVAIMQLEEQKKIKITDPISSYIESIPNDWKKITIKQLLSHTSGLPDIENDKGLIGGKGNDTAWAMVKKLPLQFKAGEKFSYNTTNYYILQQIIEKCSKNNYIEFIQKNQFNLAGMNPMFFGNSFDVFKNKAPTYSFYTLNPTTGEYIKNEKPVEVIEEFSSKIYTDSGAFSNAEEMAKWVIALQSGIFFKNQESLKTIWQAVKLNDGTYDGFGGILNAYALGWPVIQRNKNPAVAPIGGGRASFIIYPKDNLSIILFTNLSGVEPQQIIDNVAKFYLED